jgi:hypothetical protein
VGDLKFPAMPPSELPEEMRATRREWILIRTAAEAGDSVPYGLIEEEVSTTGLEHPEWDMSEVLTREEWEAWELTHLSGGHAS